MRVFYTIQDLKYDDTANLMKFIENAAYSMKFIEGMKSNTQLAIRIG